MARTERPTTEDVARTLSDVSGTVQAHRYIGSRVWLEISMLSEVHTGRVLDQTEPSHTHPITLSETERDKMKITKEQMKQVQETLNTSAAAVGAVIQCYCDGLEQSGVRTSFSKSDYGKGKWNANLTVEFTAVEEEKHDAV